MKINQAGIDLIKSFEKCVLTAYQDAGGVWTCGWGATGPAIKEGTVWSQATADQDLEIRISQCEEWITKLVRSKLTPNQFSALVCFVYNEGYGHFENSTMLKLLNEEYGSGIQAAAEEFPKWNKVGGVVCEGLVRRRAAERELFLTS